LGESQAVPYSNVNKARRHRYRGCQELRARLSTEPRATGISIYSTPRCPAKEPTSLPGDICSVPYLPFQESGTVLKRTTIPDMNEHVEKDVSDMEPKIRDLCSKSSKTMGRKPACARTMKFDRALLPRSPFCPRASQKSPPLGHPELSCDSSRPRNACTCRH
jgi:hypothetical protein